VKQYKRQIKRVLLASNYSDIDPFAWWRKSSAEHGWRFLPVAAQAILSVVSSSAPVERLFSTAGDVLDERRTALLDDNFEALVLFHETYTRRNSLLPLQPTAEIDDKDLPAALSLADFVSDTRPSGNGQRTN